MRDSVGMSGAEIALVCKEAGLKALSEDLKIETTDIEEIKIRMSHILESLKEVRERGKVKLF